MTLKPNWAYDANSIGSPFKKKKSYWIRRWPVEITDLHFVFLWLNICIIQLMNQWVFFRSWIWYWEWKRLASSAGHRGRRSTAARTQRTCACAATPECTRPIRCRHVTTGRCCATRVCPAPSGPSPAAPPPTTSPPSGDSSPPISPLNLRYSQQINNYIL